jgi:hypothetical protein
MLEPLIIEPTDLTPEVNFIPEKGIFEIKGRSLPEDVFILYDPMLNWIRQYITEPLPQTNMVFYLEYFNSSTARLIIKLLLELEEIPKMGYEVNVKWYYSKGDTLMQERGEEIKSVVLLPFEIIEVE